MLREDQSALCASFPSELQMEFKNHTSGTEEAGFYPPQWLLTVYFCSSVPKQAQSALNDLNT